MPPQALDTRVLPLACNLRTCCVLQGGEGHRRVLDQLYDDEAEATLSGTLEAQDGPSTVSR